MGFNGMCLMDFNGINYVFKWILMGFNGMCLMDFNGI